MLQKIDITELEIGMFVAELDRPWLESPFLFQGFLIENQEELGRIQELCDYVFIDMEKSAEPERKKGLVARLRHMGSKAPGPKDRLDPKQMFTAAYNEQRLAHHHLKQGVIKLLDDHRLGRMVETSTVRTAVSRLVGSLLENPDAAVWLTRLKGTDEYTQAHSLNVAVLASAFAHHLGYDADEIEAIGMGGILHDIGLSEVATAILTKKADLTEEEFAVVREHPLQAFDSMESPEKLPSMTRDIIRWHHERLDGSGYPDGLSGDEIPRHVRIVGLADTYDAMVSDRAYRRGMLPSDALQEILRDADDTFGRRLAQEFIGSIGIYPPGSVVRLNTGAVAAVVASNRDARLSPLVLMLKTPEGEPLEPPRLIDLSGIERKVGQRWFIQEIVQPESVGVDLDAISDAELQRLG